MPAMGKESQAHGGSVEGERIRMGRAEQILNLAQELIQTGGYNAFSYQDLSGRLGIRKASIHYHFPRKEDLGAQVVRRYTTMMSDLFSALDADRNKSSWQKLDAYLQPFIEVCDSQVKVCLCGVLGGELVSLPPTIQEGVAKFFSVHEEWLARLFEFGRTHCDFQFSARPVFLAKTWLAGLQGALLIARAHNDPGHFYRVVEVLKNHLAPASDRNAAQ